MARAPEHLNPAQPREKAAARSSAKPRPVDSNTATYSFAPAGSAEAKAASCPANKVCLWNQNNFQGDKLAISKRPQQCYNYTYGYIFPVKSLITGKNRGIVAMRTERNCKGTPSKSYDKGVKVKKADGKYGFEMVSVR